MTVLGSPVGKWVIPCRNSGLLMMPILGSQEVGGCSALL
jgi:hypothetical protein